MTQIAFPMGKHFQLRLRNQKNNTIYYSKLDVHLTVGFYLVCHVTDIHTNIWKKWEVAGFEGNCNKFSITTFVSRVHSAVYQTAL